jgi:hypothetical protein
MEPNASPCLPPDGNASAGLKDPKPSPIRPNRDPYEYDEDEPIAPAWGASGAVGLVVRGKGLARGGGTSAWHSSGGAHASQVGLLSGAMPWRYLT